MNHRIATFLAVCVLACVAGAAQAQQQKSDSQNESPMQDMKGMDHSQMSHSQKNDSKTSDSQSMPGMDMSKSDSSSDSSQRDSSQRAGAEEMGHTMSSMSSKHMDMGPHMKMTALRPANADDQKRAEEIVTDLRGAIEKYKDFKVALAEGFQIFQPQIPTPMKHFTNYGYAFEAEYKFNPLHPTSLLYEKHGDDYKLVGAMYTAPKRFTEDQLNERIPLSVAQWHEHVNLCMPPKGQERAMFTRNARFGLAGSISTQAECEAAGGTFRPIIFNWMVHVYPYEKKPEEVWAVEHGQHHQGVN
jgi:hypothetical protein